MGRGTLTEDDLTPEKAKVRLRLLHWIGRLSPQMREEMREILHIMNESENEVIPIGRKQAA